MAASRTQIIPSSRVFIRSCLPSIDFHCCGASGRKINYFFNVETICRDGRDARETPILSVKGDIFDGRAPRAGLDRVLVKLKHNIRRLGCVLKRS